MAQYIPRDGFADKIYVFMKIPGIWYGVPGRIGLGFE
jgi:hypothetical protein